MEKKRKNRPFLLALWEFFNGEDYSSDDIGIEERRRVPVYLANAQQQLIDIFEVIKDGRFPNFKYHMIWFKHNFYRLK